MPNVSNAFAQSDVKLDSLVANVVDEFRTRQKRGEQPEVAEYEARYPEAGTLLRRVLAAMQLLDASDIDSENGVPDDRLTGTLGDFRLIREVGRGGMGIVYEAEQISLGRRVALKVLPFAATFDPRHLQRFQNESRAAASLHHQNIVPVFAVSQDRGVHFFAMQFIDGHTLAAMLDEERGDAPTQSQEQSSGPSARSADTVLDAATTKTPRDAEFHRRVAEWGIQAADALEYAHSFGIVHRDIKPGNLMIDLHGQLWVTDFGLARRTADSNLTMSGDMLGTLRYMSPEQALAKHDLVDQRSDVYSLGATLYEVLTLHSAAEGNDRQEILHNITHRESRSLRSWDRTIPIDLETIVLKALAKEPEARYATAKELADDLRRQLNHEPILARPATLSQRLSKWARRNRHLVRAAAAALIVTSIVAVASSVLVGAAYRDEAFHRKNAEEKEKFATKAAEAEKKAVLEAKADFERAEAHAANAHEAVERFLTRMAMDRLKNEPGAERLKQKLLEDALQFYQRFLAESPKDNKARLDLARAYYRISLVEVHLGDLAKASEATQSAGKIVESLLAENPREAAYRYTKSLVLNGQASIHFRQRDYKAALPHALKSFELLDSLVTEFPENAQYSGVLATTLSNLGNIHKQLNQNDKALEYQRRALTALEQLIKRDPKSADYRRGVATVHLQIAGLYEAADRHDKAAEELNQAILIQRQLLQEEPNSEETLEDLAGSLNNLGNALNGLNKTHAADEALEECAKLYYRLTTAYPTVPDYADRALRLSIQVRRAGDKSGAHPQKTESAFRRELALQERMSALQPNDRKLQTDLAHLRSNFAFFLANCPDPKVQNGADARQLVMKALKVNDQEPRYWRSLGMANYRMGLPGDAIQAFERGIALQKGGVGQEFFYLCMACLRDKEKDRKKEAIVWFSRGVDWMARHKSSDPELQTRLFREASTMMNLLDLRNVKRLEILPEPTRSYFRDIAVDIEMQKLKKTKGLRVTFEANGTLNSKTHEIEYSVELLEGKTYCIELTSAFDTVLRLTSQQGDLICENDDILPNNRNSRVLIRPEETYTYRLVATSFERKGSGPFSLTVSEILVPIAP